MKSGHLLSLGVVAGLFLLKRKNQKANMGYIGSTNRQADYHSLYRIMASDKSFDTEIIKTALSLYKDNIDPFSNKGLSIAKDTVVKYFSEYNNDIDLQIIPTLSIQEMSKLLADAFADLIENDLDFLKRNSK